MRRTANHRLRLVAVLTVASLGLLGCGSSDDITAPGASAAPESDL